MSVLRIYCPLHAGPPHCRWTFSQSGRAPVHGEGKLAEVPRGATRVQVVIPAAEVLLTHVKLPRGAQRRGGTVLAFAVEEATLGDPETLYASRLGAAGDGDALAVMERAALERWLDALAAEAIERYEVLCETLLLPRAAGEWSLAWDGCEGFVRTGEMEGAATDSGTGQLPPLGLRLMLESAAAGGAPPAAIAIYTTVPGAQPELDAWQRELGIELRLAGAWDWRDMRYDSPHTLKRKSGWWRGSMQWAPRLRPALWIAGGALALHMMAVAVDWLSLRNEQRALGRQMEARFKSAVPEAVAIVDPALQMRRKLADARHASGVADSGDFLPMIEQVAGALKDLPAGSLRVAAYEQGRLSLELSGVDEAGLRRFRARMLEKGVMVEAPRRSGSGALIVTVRPS